MIYVVRHGKTDWNDKKITMEEFKDRVYSFMDELSNNSDEDILLVTHGGVSALINCYFDNKEYTGSISNMFLRNGDVARYEK